jgi:ABC-type glutathione transport system ATPase component
MSNQILDLFRELNRSLGLTVVIVTHDPLLAKKVDRVVAIRDGKTSSEFIRSRSYADELAELEQGMAVEEETHVEYAILDKAGRLQIPSNYLEAVGVKNSNKMVVTLEDGKIVLLPPQNETVSK